jgi:X-X-X-Leu-X-X-Gly heptad repeat protein
MAISLKYPGIRKIRSEAGMIQKIKTKIRKSGNISIFHDSRTDINTLSKVCNELTNKVNELVDKVNEMVDKVNELEKANDKR